MALSTVDVPSDDSGRDDSEGSDPLAWANGTPLAPAPEPKTGAAYDVRLLEALRRVSVLQAERVEANRAFNKALSRSLELERRLSDSQAALGHARAQFNAYVCAEIARISAENDAVGERLARLQSGVFWRVGVAVRSIRARLSKRA